MSSYGPWRYVHNAGDEDARLSWPLARRVWSFARRYRAKIGLLLGVIALTALLGAAPPLLYRAVIDDAIAQQRLGLLNLLALALLAVAVAGAAAQVASRWLSSHVGEGLILDLRVALFDHIQRMPLAFFSRTHTGALISRLTTDLVGGHRVFTETLASVVSTLLGVIVTLAVMLRLDWRLTAVALTIAPLFVIISRRMRGQLHRLMTQQADATAAMSTQMTERFQVGGALLVKLFGRPGGELDRFRGHATELRDAGVEASVYSRVFHVAFGLVTSVGAGLVFWYGGRLAVSGAVTIGTIVAFAAYLTQLYTPLTMLANARVDLAGALVSFQRVFEVLDHPSPLVDRPGATELVDPRGRVELDQVWFRYPPSSEVSIDSLVGGQADEGFDEDAWALRGVSAVIEPGQTVALVGPSGAGKTTTSLVVARLYDVTEGTVRVDGHDVRDLTMESLAAAVGTVTQDPHLFHDTVRNNLLYARPDATEDELVAAATAAQIHDLLDSLPDRYDTVVGERGYRLSGGEKQRLAIARLLLKDPAIMILDEATAHLDSESEVLIQRALRVALEGRSSLVIAHRLSTVVNADQILVLDRGRVVERGTHLELLAASGLYATLFRLQFERAELGSAPARSFGDLRSTTAS